MDLETILDLSEQAAAAGEFEVSYHLLMAAVHLADHRGDMPGLGRVAMVAKSQGERIEALTPAHRLSRSYAAARGHTALFDTLQTHVRSVELRHEADRQRRTLRP